MNIYSTMPLAEFVAGFREHAIRSGVPPAVIDKIDELADQPELEVELEELSTGLEDMTESRDDLADALRDLIEAFALRDLIEALPPIWTDKVLKKGDEFGLKDSLQKAKWALSRSSGNKADEI